MYNEDDNLFTRTMQGVIKVIAYSCRHGRSKAWSWDGRKKVVDHIVSDSLRKVNSRILSVVETMGAYQVGIATNVIDRKPVAERIYEYTTQSTSHGVFSAVLRHPVEQDRRSGEGN